MPHELCEAWDVFSGEELFDFLGEPVELQLAVDVPIDMDNEDSGVTWRRILGRTTYLGTGSLKAQLRVSSAIGRASGRSWGIRCRACACHPCGLLGALDGKSRYVIPTN